MPRSKNPKNRICPYGCRPSDPFSRPADLTRHLKEQHQPEKRCPYPDCDHLDRRIQRLKEHVQDKHRSSIEALAPAFELMEQQEEYIYRGLQYFRGDGILLRPRFFSNSSEDLPQHYSNESFDMTNLEGYGNPYNASDMTPPSEQMGNEITFSFNHITAPLMPNHNFEHPPLDPNVGRLANFHGFSAEPPSVSNPPNYEQYQQLGTQPSDDLVDMNEYTWDFPEGYSGFPPEQNNPSTYNFPGRD